MVEEFKSLGFYISDHPLNEYKEIFNQLKIVSYDEFYNNDSSEGLVGGTIMSINEKKSAKGTPYAIVKFSDKKGEFELFLFAEILVKNREKLIESESFILNLQKDKTQIENLKKELMLEKYKALDNLIDKPYSKVTIELKENFKINEIKEILSTYGDTEINLVINNQNKKANYSLQKNRKFDLNHFKALKSKEYVTKIIV